MVDVFKEEAELRDPWSPAVIRENFPAIKTETYMDVANQGLISQRTFSAAELHLSNRLLGINDEMEMLAFVERTRARLAQFIGARPAEIAFTKNASEGINIIANALVLKPGDNIVLCPALEHANNVLPWQHVAARSGAQLLLLESSDGRYPMDEFCRSIDERTRVVALSTTTLVPGLRTQLPQMAQACRNAGAFLFVDASQSVGILETDVASLGVDGLVSSTVKGLMGFYGLGFLFCCENWLDRLVPAYASRFGISLADKAESAATRGDFEFHGDARRFDVGHYNFPAVLAAYSSVGELSALGQKRIEAHVISLARSIETGLKDMHIPIYEIKEEAERSSIVSIGEYGSTPQWVGSLHEYLQWHEIITSVRRGMLRISLHFYNSEADVTHLLAHLERWKAGRTIPPPSFPGVPRNESD